MDEFKESVKELKTQLSSFIKEYYDEILKLWIKISKIETQIKFFMLFYGAGITIISSTITGLIMYFLTK